MNISLGLNDLFALSPLLIILSTGLILLLLESFAAEHSKKYSIFLTITGLALALLAAIIAPESLSPLLTPWLKFDSVSRFFTLFFIAIGLGSSLLACSFFQRFDAAKGEYYFLLLSALFGLILIGSSADFLMLFLGIETLSLSLYVLCGYMKNRKVSREAAIKYFFMGSLAAAFLLYGIALIYGATGTTRFEDLLPAYEKLTGGTDRSLFLCGIALVTLALAFEAAVVPFQVWAPDVYDAAPTPVTAFMAVGTKVGAFAALIRIFILELPNFDMIWNQSVAFLIYPTLIFANFVALRQSHLRRFFAYSGISHAGFLLIPLVAATSAALPALLFYLVVYAAATMGAFAILAYLDHSNEGVKLEDMYGLFLRAPYLAVIFTICFLTLAGIPPAIGFFAKFYLLKEAFQAGYYGLIITALLTSILSAYYYLHFVSVMFTQKPPENKAPVHLWPAAIVGTVSCAVIIIISVFPASLLNFLNLNSP